MKQLKDLARRLGVTILDLLTSKKAIAAAVGAVVAHFIQDPTKAAHVVEIVIGYVASQGIVDHAKATAEGKLGLAGVAPLVAVDARAPAPPAPGA